MTFDHTRWYSENRDEILSQNRAKYAANKEALKAKRLIRLARKPQRYLTEKPCKWGHLSLRHRAGGCLECHRLREKARRDKTRKPKIVVTLSEQERRDKQRAANRRSYLKYKEERAAVAAARYARNPEKIKTYNRTKYYSDLDKSRAQLAIRTARRRARKANAGGDHSLEDRQRVWNHQNGQCAYAKFGFTWCIPTLTRKTAEWDHIVPIYLGGTNDAANGQWLCYSCNSRKGYKEEGAFLKQNGAQDLFACVAA